MATNAAQEAWMNSAVGRSMNPDGAYGLQCVDVADDYAQAIFGVSWSTAFGGGGNANQRFPRNNGYFTSIGYNGNNRPERGDIIVWGGDGVNPYGHIAVVASSTKSNVSVYQQNYNTPTPTKPCSLDVMPYSATGMGRCVGWLRPNVPGATTPDPGEIVLGNGGGAVQTASAIVRRNNQRWAESDCEVREEARSGAPVKGRIKKGDLCTMAGYVLGDWVTWNGRNSSFWFKVTEKGTPSQSNISTASSVSHGAILDGMDWDKLAMLESSGRWDCNTGNGFYGGIQFTYTTWLEFGGGKYAEYAHQATREQQIEIGRKVLKGQGVMAWPNTGPKCYDPSRPDSNGSGGNIETAAVVSGMEPISGYVPFVFFNPQETYGVPDVTPYHTWTVTIPDPPRLPADAPEAHWSGNQWVGWQWNDNHSSVIWVAPAGHADNGAYTAKISGLNAAAAAAELQNYANGTGASYPEAIPTTEYVNWGDVSEAMWNYLMYIGWRGKNTDGHERLYRPGTVGTTIDIVIPNGPVNWGEVPEATWNRLKDYGWYAMNTDGRERLYPPERPIIVSPAYGSAQAIVSTSATYGAVGATISESSKTGIVGSWRYIAQRATTGEFLDMDLPISRDELTWELSGPGSLRGTVSPDYGQLRAEDGRLLLEEWNTLIYAEADGEIRWGGILISSTFNGQDWTLECAGFSAYPSGMPYMGEFSETGADAGEVIRHIWDHLQSFERGTLGVRVTDSVTGRLVGLPTGPVTQEQVPYNVWYYLTHSNWTQRDGDNSGRIYPPNYDGDIPPRENQDPLDPYELLWWEAPDCGRAIDNLVKDAPLDYVERHAWEGDDIRHEIQIKYPRTGRRRNDLAFIQGDNVISVVAPTINGDYYANSVVGLGAGEGSGAIRRSTASNDGRLRRTYIYSGKDTTSAAQLDRIIDDELRARQGLLAIEQIEVRNHPNAPIGSWALGDDILVRADIPWRGEIEIWCRITGWSLTSDSTATLRLERSDAYSYGAEVEAQPEDGPIWLEDAVSPYPSDDIYPDDDLYPNDPAFTTESIR